MELVVNEYTDNNIWFCGKQDFVCVCVCVRVCLCVFFCFFYLLLLFFFCVFGKNWKPYKVKCKVNI